MRLLVVEDERDLAALMRVALERAGFAIDLAHDLGAAADHLAAARYESVILDLALPDGRGGAGDGLSLLRGLRARRNSLPVLVLTARAALEDRVSGLDAGADDYLVKPFHMAELIARIRALLRRPGAALGATLEVANRSFDSTTRQALASGADVGLSARESGLLELLLRRRGAVVPRQALEDGLQAMPGNKCSWPANPAFPAVRCSRPQKGRSASLLRKTGFSAQDHLFPGIALQLRFPARLQRDGGAGASAAPQAGGGRGPRLHPYGARHRLSARRGRMSGWSLSRRLGWRLAAVTVSAVLLAGGAIAWRAIATVHEIDDSALQAQAGLIAASLPAAPGPDGRISLPDPLAAQFLASDGDNPFAVYHAGRLAAASDPAAIMALAGDLPSRMRPGFFRLPPLAGHGHGMVGLVTRAGPWRIVTLQGREQTRVLLDSLVGHFLAALVWLLLPIGAATVLVGVLTISRGLRPLRRASAAAARIDPAQLGARLPVADLPTEVVPLVQAVNDALARLERALGAQRAFMAEAAHALRTPLAVLTARLDLAQADAAVPALRQDVDRMSRLVGQLLRMARMEALPLALRAGVDLALLEGQPVSPVQGNGPALVLAVTNLIENALAYAPAPTPTAAAPNTTPTPKAARYFP